MQDKLSQRKFFLTKRFEITQRALKIETKTPISFEEEEIHFENIGTSFTRKKSFSLPFGVILICAVGFLALLTVSYICTPTQESISSLIVVGAGTLISLFTFLFTFSDVINVTTNGGKVISFITSSPSRDSVQEFIDTFKSEQKKFMLKKYASTDINLTNDQLINNLHWLWNRNIIDEEEFDALNKKVNIKTDNPSGMGFKFDPSDN